MAFRNLITSLTQLTGQITSTQIAPGAITTPKLAANAITGQTITGGLIIGALIETAATGGRIVLDGARDAYFLYDSTGALILSMAPAPGTDALGNPYPAGLNVSGGNLINIPAPLPGSVALTSEAYGDAFARFNLLVDGTHTWGGGTAAADTNLYRPFTGQLQTDGKLGVTGILKAGTWVVKETAGSDEAWQAPSYAANWSGASTFGTLTNLQALQYRADAFDNVVVGGVFLAGATTPGTAIASVGGAYTPKKKSALPITRLSAGVATSGSCYLSQTGNLALDSQLGPTPVASAVYIIAPTAVPLGNLP